MKTTIITIMVVCGVLFVGCNNSRDDNGKPNPPPYPKGTVFFDNTGVSLIPGNEWNQLRTGEFTDDPRICLPVLKGFGKHDQSVLQVLKSEGNEGLDQAARNLETNFESNPNTIKGTLKRISFNAANNVNGYYVCYDYYTKKTLRTDKRRAHVYLFQNANGDCVTINYISFIDKDSVPVHDMILNTLRLN